MPRREVADAVVVGGGCIGTSIAWHLARLGLGRVLLLEKGNIASGATGMSSAIIRAHYTHEALARLAIHSMRVFEGFDQIVGGHADFRKTGYLLLLGASDAGALRANVEMHHRLGIQTQILDIDEVERIEPRADLHGVGAAAWEARAGHADPVGTTAGYAAAARRLGAEIRPGVAAIALRTKADRILGVDTSQGEISTSVVALAAGYASRQLVEPLGFELPIEPIRHTVAIIQRSGQFGREHATVSDRPLGTYYRPEGKDLTLVGDISPAVGTVDHDVDRQRPPTFESLTRVTECFARRFPGQEDAVLRRGYTGVYDCTPDLQPMLGAIGGTHGLYVATGFSGHGFRLSPAVGELVADVIATGRSPLADINLFSPMRFTTGNRMHSDHEYAPSQQRAPA